MLFSKFVLFWLIIFCVLRIDTFAILQSHNETLEYWSEEIPADPKEDFHMSVDFLPVSILKKESCIIFRTILIDKYFRKNGEEKVVVLSVDRFS